MFLLMFVCPQGVCIPACFWAGGLYPRMHLGKGMVCIPACTCAGVCGQEGVWTDGWTGACGLGMGGVYTSRDERGSFRALFKWFLILVLWHDRGSCLYYSLLILMTFLFFLEWIKKRSVWNDVTHPSGHCCQETKNSQEEEKEGSEWTAEVSNNYLIREHSEKYPCRWLNNRINDHC